MELKCEICGGLMQMMSIHYAQCFGSCRRIVFTKSFEDRKNGEETINNDNNSDGSMRYGLNKTMKDE